ncbi:MAG TPA: O-antigen ligase family protein [Terracidiphilus sp.]|nr:O-antigen ligase family protein [Terracidiphilus sp.]
MPAFSTVSNSVASGVKGPPARIRFRRDLIVGVCLFGLLAYCTATVFVKAEWAIQSFQIGVFALLAVYLLSGIRQGKECVAKGVAPLLVYFIPAWGLIQILAHTTSSTIETRQSVLRWGALAAVFFLVQIVARAPRNREIILHTYLIFATVMAVLCLTQLFSSDGRVLWLFPTGYPDVYATFPSHNNYAQFIELSLPIALWYALKEGWRSWGYMLVGGTLYASVIGSASRAGALLCTVELLAMLTIGLTMRRQMVQRFQPRSITAVLAAVPLLAVTFTLVVGWQRVWQRFQQHDPYVARWEFLIPTLEMAKDRPLMGYGLGTFPDVYPQHAIVDLPVHVNYAHNDWAEFAADGGIPFFLLVFIPFAAAIPSAVRHPWSLGLVAVMAHACIDFPFPRPAVSGWIFAMLGLLYMAQNAKRDENDSDDSGGRSSPVPLQFRRRKRGR